MDNLSESFKVLFKIIPLKKICINCLTSGDQLIKDKKTQNNLLKLHPLLKIF